MRAGVTKEPAAARLLDLSRLVSRVGRGPHTGVDRVELAYLQELLGRGDALFGLVRTPSAFTLLGRSGLAALEGRLTGRLAWGRPDWRARLRRKAHPNKRAAEADLRRLALGRAGAARLADMLARHLPAATAWINTGHTNLVPAVFDAVHALPRGRASVLVHDVIPLEYPEWQRPGTVETFRRRMEAVARHADLVIAISDVTRAGAERCFQKAGRVPPMITALIGVRPAEPAPETLPDTVNMSRPYFVTLGTIEPRKNHALLLDIWEHFAATLPAEAMPALFILGSRGWANETVFTRLDKSPMMGRTVFELAGLNDGQVAALVQGARALLMPSLAEGFGLPPAEALALGTPVIANNLPVYREAFGNNPIYAKVTDMYSWAEAILDLARKEKTIPGAAVWEGAKLPTWQEHFNLVLKVT